jgi:hypothetical protein
MANRTSWVAGNGVGFTWSQLFSSTAATDINQTTAIPTGSCVLSTITISNQTALDMFMDISARFTIGTAAAAGANFSFYLFGLLDDGSTYGDGSLTAGTVSTNVIAIPPFAVLPLRAGTTATGYLQGLSIPPGTFKMVFQNNSGFSLGSTGNVCMYRTYNINLND